MLSLRETPLTREEEREAHSWFENVKKGLKYARKKSRHLLCIIFHGKHELYRAWNDTKIYQTCILCGYETRGFTIDRRDRRIHLVTDKGKRV